MNLRLRFPAVAVLISILSSLSLSQISISYSQFAEYFSVGKPVTLLADTTVFSTGLVDVGQKGGPNIYDFSGLTLFVYAEDTLRSVSEIPAIASRYPSEYFTFAIPEGEDGTDHPIISLTTSGMAIPGQYRTYTADSAKVRHSTPPEPFVQLPLTYGDSIRVTSSFADTTLFFGDPVMTEQHSRTKSVVVDGYGTVIVPGGTAYDALRVRDMEEDQFGGKEFRFILLGGGMLFVSTANTEPDTGLVQVQDPVQWIINPTITNVVEEARVPSGFELAQNYPNPFNPVTTIRFSLPERMPVRLGIYSMLGQQIAVLVDDEMGQGWHSVRWDGASSPSGVYFAHLQAGSNVLTKKLVLVR